MVVTRTYSSSKNHAIAFLSSRGFYNWRESLARALDYWRVHLTVFHQPFVSFCLIRFWVTQRITAAEFLKPIWQRGRPRRVVMRITSGSNFVHLNFDHVHKAPWGVRYAVPLKILRRQLLRGTKTFQLTLSAVSFLENSNKRKQIDFQVQQTLTWTFLLISKITGCQKQRYLKSIGLFID